MKQEQQLEYKENRTRLSGERRETKAAARATRRSTQSRSKTSHISSPRPVSCKRRCLLARLKHRENLARLRSHPEARKNHPEPARRVSLLPPSHKL